MITGIETLIKKSLNRSFEDQKISYSSALHAILMFFKETDIPEFFKVGFFALKNEIFRSSLLYWAGGRRLRHRSDKLLIKPIRKLPAWQDRGGK